MPVDERQITKRVDFKRELWLTRLQSPMREGLHLAGKGLYLWGRGLPGHTSESHCLGQEGFSQVRFGATECSREITGWAEATIMPVSHSEQYWKVLGKSDCYWEENTCIQYSKWHKELLGSAWQLSMEILSGAVLWDTRAYRELVRREAYPHGAQSHGRHRHINDTMWPPYTSFTDTTPSSKKKE